MLHGLRDEAECQLIAWHLGESSTCYTQMRVIEAPLSLPDWIYTLVVEDKVYSTEKRQGWWLMVHAERECA
jgi:hypothetical protein